MLSLLKTRFWTKLVRKPQESKMIGINDFLILRFKFLICTLALSVCGVVMDETTQNHTDYRNPLEEKG